MKSYASHVSRKTTVQTEQAAPEQVKNHAGGYVFEVDKWMQFTRFLILGAEGPTYYAGEHKMVKDNAKAAMACIAENGARAVTLIVDISLSGRAPKNDPAIFALALAASADDDMTRSIALANVHEVCRIGTHLFQFVQQVQELRGWGHALRKAVANWYLRKSADDAAYQIVKYQNRLGFSHRDLLRLSHPRLEKDAEGNYKSPAHQAVFRYAVKGEVLPDIPNIIEGWEKAKVETNPKKLAKLISEYKLTHEMVLTEMKNHQEVWAALLPHMPIGALVRNLAKMTACGLLKPLSMATEVVTDKLVDVGALKKGRMHPIGLLSALKVYGQGHGEKGKLTWSPVGQITDALDEAFYLAFDAIEPTGKRWLLGVDISGSMDSGTIAGIPGMTPRMVAAAMAMVTMRTEKQSHVIGFTSSGGRGVWGGYGAQLGVTPIDISPKMRLDKVIQVMQALPMGSTDCAMPVTYAQAQKLDVDAFATYTDNETFAGPIHVHQALKQYRQKTGINSKLLAVACTATSYTIADPKDPGMMDFVGFDTAAPQVMADFVRSGSPESTVPWSRDGEGPWQVAGR